MREKTLYQVCEKVSFVRNDSTQTAITYSLALLLFCMLGNHRVCTQSPRDDMKACISPLLTYNFIMPGIAQQRDITLSPYNMQQSGCVWFHIYAFLVI